MARHSRGSKSTPARADEPTTVHHEGGLIDVAYNKAQWLKKKLPDTSNVSPKSSDNKIYTPRLARVAVIGQDFHIEVRNQTRHNIENLKRLMGKMFDYRSKTFLDSWIRFGWDPPMDTKPAGAAPPQPLKVASVVLCERIIENLKSELEDDSEVSTEKDKVNLGFIYLLVVEGLEGSSVRKLVRTDSAQETADRIFREISNGYNVSFVGAVPLVDFEVVNSLGPPKSMKHVLSFEELTPSAHKYSGPKLEVMSILC